MNRIKELRKNKHIAQGELADYLGISTQAISLYERNEREPKLATWQKLADFFNVDVAYLQGTSPYRHAMDGIFSSQNENKEIPVIDQSELDKLLSRFDENGGQQLNREWQARQDRIKSEQLTPILIYLNTLNKESTETELNFNEQISDISLRSQLLTIIDNLVYVASNKSLEHNKLLKEISNKLKNESINIITKTALAEEQQNKKNSDD
ncbi:transcriptional regulator, Cro/CI family [Fructobacillus fructosus]|uniref:helix-turn-helix domain-containing protein n=1 Tax=Fructobacillus fructosus TaxID=1631 RepID=UPI00021957E1|nr:helix-turn-helix transcriptional regulator [Fructobacillus fructosus]KRN52312.1 Cro CI family transcriptional regulator [Fructobacillus fructosus KCTC 3544]GAP01395.1 transcriptional regulator, Cro/CI family [Fructobacillus fructosus]